MCSLPTRRLAAMVAMVGLVLTGSAAAQGLIQDSDLFPVVGGPYESLNSAVFDTGTLQAEIVSVSLIGNGLTTPVPSLSLAPGYYHIDSFFDVWTELSVDGGPTQVDSFFDVFVDLTIEPSGAVGVFQTEIVSMSLSGEAEVAGLIVPFLVRESPQLESTGPLTIMDIGGGQFQIDSFFDVWTEFSVDGGNTWVLADAPLAFRLTPEPSTLGLLAVGALGLMLPRRRRQ